eukprot:7387456-Prymnesium_polylepis.2
MLTAAVEDAGHHNDCRANILGSSRNRVTDAVGLGVGRDRNLAIEPFLDQVVWRRLEEPAESTAATLWVVLVHEDNLDAKRPRSPDLVREGLAVFAHERCAVERSKRWFAADQPAAESGSGILSSHETSARTMSSA